MKLSTKIYLFFFTLIVTTQVCYAKNAAPVFDVTTSQHVYAIGHPIDVIFETHNISRSLSSLNLNILNKYFVIHDYNIDKFEDVINGKFIRIENLVVRLYPRRAGQLEIPAFKIGRFRSKPIFLDIINDFNSAIQIRTTVIKKSYYQREPINIYVDVFYRKKKITSKIGELKNKNFIISDVVKTEYTINDNGLILPVDRFSWIVLPLIEGEQTITLPMVKTGGRRMYPSGKLKIKVSPLPSSLPALVPVSKQTITNNFLTQDKVWINKVYYWSLSVEGNGLNENILEKILNKQLKTDSNIRYFPRSYQRTRINNGSKFKTDIKIPFKIYKTGNFTFPILDIPYIDANTGILEHTFSNKTTLNATSSLNENLKIILAIILFIIIITQPVIKLLKRFYIKYRYRVCYYAIVISSNPKRIKKLIFKLTPHFNQDNASTINSWVESSEITNPEQRLTLKKIGILLNNFNYGTRYSKNEIDVLKKMVRGK